MILCKIDIDSDLSEAAVEGVLSNLYDQQNRTLYVSTAEIDRGMQIAKKYNLKLYVDDQLVPDAWYVKSKYFGIFSPGA
jgi:hypothetical protein